MAWSAIGRRGIIFLLVLAIFSFYGFHLAYRPDSDRPDDRMDQFLLFGDSITQQAYAQDSGFGFAAALSNDYVRKLDIINRGLSGYNTRQALSVLPQVVPKPQDTRVRLMTIFFGANDARLPNTRPDPQQHIPLEEFAANVKAIATHASVAAHRDIRLILVTPPPVDERKLLQGGAAKFPDQEQISRRTAAVTAKYAQAVRDVGRELGLPVLDIWTAMIERAGGKQGSAKIPGSAEMPESEILQGFLHDGLHFSAEGNRVLYDELLAVIRTNWPDQLPEELPFVWLRWDDDQWQK